MTNRVFLAEDRLAVQTSFALKDVCKSIPGARWNPQHKVWTYPVTPSAAKAIHQAFPARNVIWSEDAAALLLEAETIAKAAAHKVADDLPAIPITKTSPWKHQLRAYHFAKDLSAVMLALDMGVGKTKIAIDLIINRGWKRVLILCPKSVVSVWPMEFDKHCPLVVGTLTLDEGSIIQRTRKLTAFLDLQAVRNEPAVVILNYDAAWRAPIGEIILNRSWDAVICDESHRIKAPGGKAALFCSRLGDQVPARLCLTGTPLPHSPLDGYAQYRFLDKGIFGTSFTNFRARYALMGGYGFKQVIGFQNQDDFNTRFYSIAYRVKSEDVLTLPDAIDVVRPVMLGPYAREVYEQLKRDFVVGVGDGSITASNAMTRLLRLQQIAAGWVRQDRNIETGEEGPLVQIDQSKQEVLADLLEDLSHDEPIAIFCRFHHDLDAVHTVATALGRTSVELSGRRNELQEWQAGTAPILAVQVQSGGVGINLTRARYCVFYSLGFSLGEYLQARKRTHRPGQTRTVTYFHLIAKKTVDEQVYKALEARQDVVETILRQAQHD